MVFLIILRCYHQVVEVSLVFEVMTQQNTYTTGTSEFYKNVKNVDFSVADATPDDLTVKLVTNHDKIVLFNDFKLDSVPTFLIVHGWTTDDTSPWYEPLKNALTKEYNEKLNVLYVDWSKAGNKSYGVSAANVQPIGRFIAQFLIDTKLDPKLIHLIGHSLGGHVVGFTGKFYQTKSGQKLGRITSLDAAGPGFERLPESLRLSPDDAEFVDSIHTDIKFYGYAAPLGHVAFYPNRGQHQPGCPKRSQSNNCSHARSTLYFIESIGTYVWTKPASYQSLDQIEMTNSEKQAIFGFKVHPKTRGVYLFNTNASEPFLR